MRSAQPLDPFAGLDVWHLLCARAQQRGEFPFVVWHPYADGVDPQTLSYSEVHRWSAALGAGMVRHGVTRGDRVLLHLENCPEFVAAWFACAAIGAVAVTTNVRSAGPELAYFAEDCAAVGAITQPKYAERVATSAPHLRWLYVTDHDAGEPADGQGSAALRRLAGDPHELVAAPADPSAPMSVQYTSGTTSRPKGVLWTHANALWGARVNAAHEDLHPGDCHLVYHPLFHTNGLAFSMLASLWVGARFVLVPKWSTSRFWDVSIRHGCTWLSLMGLSQRVLDRDEPPRDHRYRLFGGAVCDPPFALRYGVKTIGWWAMTETISHGTVGSAFMPDRPMSMGRPATEYGIAVVAEDGVTAVGAGEVGELLVQGTRGLSLFAEYLNQPESTAACFDDDGWFHTGDLVEASDDGYLV